MISKSTIMKESQEWVAKQIAPYKKLRGGMSLKS